MTGLKCLKKKLVGEVRTELTTFCSQNRRAKPLRYTPTYILTSARLILIKEIGRGGEDRTHDFLFPKQTR